MKIISCKINNYKSIAEGNVLYVEDSVTAVIGKNESGKSNVLEAIGNNSFSKPLTQNYINCLTRNTDSNVSYSVYLDFWDYECEKYNIKNTNTIVEYVDTSSIKLSGGLSLLLKNDAELTDLIEEVNKEIKSPGLWINDATVKQNLATSCEKLNNIYEKIFINSSLSLNAIGNKAIKTHEMYESLMSTLNRLDEILKDYYSILPQIYYRSVEPTFNYSYKFDQFNDSIKDPNCLLKNFILAIGLTLEDFENAFKSLNDGTKRTARKKITKSIKDNITEKFNDFYTLEKIKIEAEFENNVFKLYVITEDKAMTLNERSNGLKWYLNLFIDIQAQHLRKNSVVYIFDEPGIYLHVNAQKELLSLFSDLAKKNNQIIYSTHSPYMIDGDNILNVRAVEKDEHGLTKIFRNAYDQDLSKYSKDETLSPLVNALGCDLKFNLGPDKNNNLITEGISDYMYVKAMMYHLDIDNTYSVIPSTGVSKIDKLVSIFIGWGFDFKVLFDFDKAGYDEYQELKKFHNTLANKMYFVNQEKIPNLDQMKQYPKTIESLISSEDFDKLSNSSNGSYSSKTLSAKEFHDKIKDGSLIPEKNTITNFKNLFKLLGII